MLRSLALVVPLLLALQLSDLPRIVADLFGGDDGECCNPCEDAAPGRKCPPLCPTCACHHASQLTLPSDGVRVPPRAAHASTRTLGSARAPADPDPQSVFRPPRV